MAGRRVAALASVTPEETLLFVWNRAQDAGKIWLALDHLAGSPVTVETLFPRALPVWPCSWDPGRARLEVDLTGAGESARVLRVALHAR